MTSVFDKIINFKKSVKYHKLVAYWQFYCIFLKLNFIKYLTNKSVKIIILTEHIGDVLAFTPFVEKLKNENKNNYICWVINPNYYEILKSNPYIDFVIPIACDKVAERFLKQSRLEVIDVRFNGNNYCKYCNTTKVFHKIDEKFNLENYYNYGTLLEIFSTIAKNKIDRTEGFSTLVIPEKVELHVSNKIENTKYITLHIESNDIEREWDDEKWALLIKYLKTNTNFEVILLGLKKRLANIEGEFIDFSGKLSILETAAIIKNATFFIGIDSALAHFANNFKIKSVILLGKYRQAEKYMPFSGHFCNKNIATILFDPNIKCSEISVETVVETVKNSLEKK